MQDKGKSHYYQVRTKVESPQRSGVGWICRVFDFFGSLKFTASGRTRDEARNSAATYRDQLRAKEHENRSRSMKGPKGERWGERSLGGFGGRPDLSKAAGTSRKIDAITEGIIGDAFA